MAHFPILVELRHSHVWRLFSWGLCLLLCGIFAYMDWPPLARITLPILCALLFFWVQPVFSESLELSLSRHGNLRFRVVEQEIPGDWEEASLLRVQLLLPWITLFTIQKVSGGTKICYVLPDSCSSQASRRLRVWLLSERHSTTPRVI